MPAPSETERDLQLLATELRRLEGEYNMYFAGRVPRPPHETRARVVAMLKRLDRSPLEQLTQRFRLQTLQARYATFSELWDRGLRAREEGRPGPFGGRPRPQQGPDEAPPPGERIVHVASFGNPLEEMDRLRQLYEALMEARHQQGEAGVPFHRFADLVRDQVKQMRTDGADEVAFRVAIKEGKVRLTARAMKNVE